MPFRIVNPGDMVVVRVRAFWAAGKFVHVQAQDDCSDRTIIVRREDILGVIDAGAHTFRLGDMVIEAQNHLTCEIRWIDGDDFWLLDNAGRRLTRRREDVAFVHQAVGAGDV